MKLLKNISSAILSTMVIASTALHADEQTIRQSLKLSMPSLSVSSVKQSEANGLYEVVVGANILYVSEDGKYLLQGHLIDIAAKKDLTEEKLSNTRVQAIDSLGKDNMIIFKPEKTKYTVSVFTDIDCGYCRKLHAEIDQYMAEGIAVQYLFYPRAGKGSESYNKAVSVWCADDRPAALTLAKNGQKLKNVSCSNPIDQHMQLGVEFEARGTPMIVTAKGNILPGYVPAKRLAQALATE